MVDKRRVVCPNCDSINAVPTDRPAEAAKCGRCHAQLFQRRPIDLNATEASQPFRRASHCRFLGPLVRAVPRDGTDLRASSPDPGTQSSFR